MARPKSNTLTQVELGIMKIVWKHGEVTVEQIDQDLRKQGHPLAGASIRKMLSILDDKGYVLRRKEGRRHLYSAKIKAKEAEKSILKDMIERVYDGSASSLVAALVDQGMVSNDDLSSARKLIAAKKREKK